MHKSLSTENSEELFYETKTIQCFIARVSKMVIFHMILPMANYSAKLFRMFQSSLHYLFYNQKFIAYSPYRTLNTNELVCLFKYFFKDSFILTHVMLKQFFYIIALFCPPNNCLFYSRSQKLLLLLAIQSQFLH